MSKNIAEGRNHTVELKAAVLKSLYNLLTFEKKGELGSEIANVKDDMEEIVACFQSANIIDGFEDGKFKGKMNYQIFLKGRKLKELKLFSIVKCYGL